MEAYLLGRLVASSAPARTGPQLAVLLRVLVDAANSGKMSSVPSQWEYVVPCSLRSHRCKDGEG